MRLANLSVEEAVGAVLVHNIADAQGHKALNKGHRLKAADLEKLRALGQSKVYVAVLEPDDVPEDEAVARIGQAVAGENITRSAPVSGRVNLYAALRGVLKLNTAALDEMNSIVGVTVATIPDNSVVELKKMVATCKTIGLALPEASVKRAEAIARELGPVVGVRALRAARVAVILTGSEQARARVEETYTAPIRSRVEELGAEVIGTEYVPEDSNAVAAAIERALAQPADCVIIAGQTSIMDADDMTPRGIRAAGGTIELYGAPVEPGNLLLLAYRGEIPIVGAPGCVKSRDVNVVDLILPRLLTGERLSRADVIKLAHGGLLV